MKQRITKTVVDAAEARATRYTIWDDELTGFGLRVEPTGAKSFVAKYRADGGGRSAPQRLMSLGRHPIVKLTDARAKAVKVLAAAALGQDPAGDLAEKRRQMTVAALIDLYEEEGLVIQRGARIGAPMKPLTAKYTMARLRHHVIPLLGTRRAAELTEGDIEAFARAVAKGKTAKDEKIGPRTRIIVKGGEGAARKVVRDLSAVLSFALRRRIIGENPVATASVRKTDGRRERFLTTEEVQRLGKALDELESAGARGTDKRGKTLAAANRKATNITRLWALTGARRNEIAALRWESVDLARGLLILDDSKTGRSIRPLGAAAVGLLESLRAAAAPETTYVFPAERGDGHYTGTKRIWPEAVKMAGLPGVTPHTLRHTLGSAAASGGEGLLLVGAILGHANARSTAIYAHVDRDPARQAADRATAGIAVALGRPPPQANDALPEAANDAA